MAPPCSTTSRARGRPFPPHAFTSSVAEPPSCRSDTYLEGISDLGARHPRVHFRVLHDNQLIRLCARFAQLLTEASVAWSVENPDSNNLWHCCGCQGQLMMTCGDVVFDACMFGAPRYNGFRASPRISMASPVMRLGTPIWCSLLSTRSRCAMPLLLLLLLTHLLMFFRRPSLPSVRRSMTCASRSIPATWTQAPSSALWVQGSSRVGRLRRRG